MKWRILELKVAKSNFYSMNFVFFHSFPHHLNRRLSNIYYVPSMTLGARGRAVNRGKKGPGPTELTFTANSIPRLIIIMKIAATEEEGQGAGGPWRRELELGGLGKMALRK